jgi:hypothetical protein
MQHIWVGAAGAEEAGAAVVGLAGGEDLAGAAERGEEREPQRGEDPFGEAQRGEDPAGEDPAGVGADPQ